MSKKFRNLIFLSLTLMLGNQSIAGNALISTTLTQSTSFGGIVKPTSLKVCKLDNAGIHPTDCAEKDSARVGLLLITGLPNKRVTVSGTTTTVDGITYTPMFGKGGKMYTKNYKVTLDQKGEAMAEIGGSIDLDPSKMMFGKKTIAPTTITALYD